MEACEYLVGFLTDVFRLPPGRGVRVLDLGCGRGQLVTALRAAGYDAFGTDFEGALPHPRPACLRELEATTGSNSTVSFEVRGAYALPFTDESFDAVVSTSVLEHVKNKRQVFSEVHRVLARGGVAIHSFPGRYYLPREPHSFVPLVPALWPRAPRPWLALWALAGVRNAFQKGKTWKKTYRENWEYCRDSLEYCSIREYEALLTAAGFRDFRCHFDYYVEHARGGYARLLRGPVLRKVVPLFEPLLREARDAVISAAK